MGFTIPKPEFTHAEIDAGFYAEAGPQHGVPSPTYLARKNGAVPELVDAARARFLAVNKSYKEHIFSAEESPLEQWAQGRAALNHLLTWYKEKEGKPLITVADFYGPDSGVQTLFPAYVESEIQAGLIAAGLVPWLVFGEEQVDSQTVRALYDGNASNTRELRQITAGADLPEVKLTFADSDVRLKKYGRAIEAAYETISGQKIDAFGHHIRRIAAQVAVDETDEALHILIAGDGTTAGSAETDSTDVDVASAGAIAYSDLLTWTFDPSEPYIIDKAVGGGTDLALIANLAEFKDSGAVDMPNINGPKSVQYKRWAGDVTGSSYVDRLVIGIDSRVALKSYRMGGFLQETDTIIKRQTKVWTFSYWKGYRKFDAAGTTVLDVNAAL